VRCWLCRVALQAINKLAEAMQVLGLLPTLAEQPPQQRQQCGSSQQQLQQQPQQPQPQQQQQARQWAIDVGACPGGWTSFLADLCDYNVIAIDPAQLHPDVLARPRVHHIQRLSTDALRELDVLLGGGQVGCGGRASSVVEGAVSTAAAARCD
jgi:hypothetical protein